MYLCGEVPCRVKQMTYKIDTCHFIAWRSVFISKRGNVTEWDIGSWCLISQWGSNISRHECALSHVSRPICPDMTLDVART